MLVLISCAFLLSPAANAWEFAGWYGGGCYPSLATHPSKLGVLLLSSDVAGVWRSEDRGDNWTPSSRGLGNLNVAVLAMGENIAYAGTQSGLFKSVDGGKTWVDDSRGVKFRFERPGSHRGVHIVPGQDSHILVGDRSGQVYVSSLDGQRWDRLGDKPFGDIAIDVVAYSKKYSLYLATSKKGIALYDLTDKKWIAVPEPVNDLILDKDDTIYIASGNEIAYSIDGAKNWIRSQAVDKGIIDRIAIKKGPDSLELVAGIRQDWAGTVQVTRDLKTWVKPVESVTADKINNPTRAWASGFQKPTSVSFDPHNDQSLYYTDWWGVWRSDDDGKTWHEIVKGSANASGSDMIIDGAGTIYAASMDQGLLVSKDGGASYKTLLPNTQFPEGGHAWRIAQTASGKLVTTFTPWNRQVFEVMTGKKESFTQKSSEGLPTNIPAQNAMWGRGYPRAMAVDSESPNRIYIGIDGDDGGGLFVSEDAGVHWQKLANQPGSLRIYNGLVAAGDKLYWGASGKGGGVYVSEDRGKTWVNRVSKLSWVFDLLRTEKGVVFAAGGDGKAAIFRSKDDGKTWAKVYSEAGTGACEALAVHPANPNVVAAGVVGWNGTSGGRVILSKDGGDTWVDITNDLPESSGPAAIAFDTNKNNIFVMLYAGSVYKMKMDGHNDV